jgi:hypothetical protein
MKIVVISKIPLLKLCRDFFRLEFGLLDYDDVLDCLCSGIRGSASDRDYIREMVHGDVWIQRHQEPYSVEQKTRLFRFFLDLRGRIINQIHQEGRVPYHLHIRYVQKFTSNMSIKFEVHE